MKNTIYLIGIMLLLAYDIVPAQGTWNRKSDILGSARFGLTSFSTTNKGYIMSGTFGGLSATAECQEYDQASDSWSQKSPIPYAFRGGAGFGLANKGYITNGANDMMFIQDLYQFNTLGNNWSTMAPFPGELRMFGSGAATSTKGYITCGLGGAINPLNDLWEYDEAANTWSARADLPGPARSDATAFVMNNKLFLFGGNDGSMALNDLWEYDPDANSWTQKSSLPDAGRKNAMIFTIGDTAYVVGGWPDNNISSAQVWEYIGSNDTWNRLDDFPGTATAGGGAFTIRNRGYIVTGYNSKECWEYVPAATSVGVSMPLMQDFSVFPNPFNDHFTIQLNRHTDDMLAVSITDIMGKQICSSVNYQAYGDKISIVDLGGIPAGVYFVTLTDKNGQVRKSKVLHN